MDLRERPYEIYKRRGSDLAPKTLAAEERKIVFGLRGGCAAFSQRYAPEITRSSPRKPRQFAPELRVFGARSLPALLLGPLHFHELLSLR